MTKKKGLYIGFLFFSNIYFLLNVFILHIFIYVCSYKDMHANCNPFMLSYLFSFEIYTNFNVYTKYKYMSNSI